MIEVLDHGYVNQIETWGSDERIVEAARMSTGKGFLGWGPVHTDACAHRISRERGDNRELPCNCTPASGDEKLLKFLWDHKHASPFEMAGVTIEVMAPIFVFREWHRHRTQCLAPNTEITLISPRGTVYKRSIEEIYQLKYGGVADRAPTRHKNGYSKSGTPVTREARRKDPWRVRVLPNCQVRTMRTFDEESQTYRVGVMRDVWESGTKEIWEVGTSHGIVRSSREHPFLTRSGWAKLGDLRTNELIASSGRVAANDRPIPPSLRQGIGVWTTMMRSRLIAPVDTCYICNREFVREEMQLDHVVPVAENLKLALDELNLKPACEHCHRKKTDKEQPDRRGQTQLGLVWARVQRKPHRVAESMTYDIEMTGPDHNYVANGLVVHNSYNEMSARYTPLPDVNYIPSVERLMINAGATNKQAGTVKGASEMTKEAAVHFQSELRDVYHRQQALYEWALGAGVPKELARIHLPVGRYSRMRASANLRNWIAFLTLRMDSAAQYEIRMYANAVAEIIKAAFPITYSLFAATTTT